MEYRFATTALRASGYLIHLKVAIAMLCMSIVVLGVIVQLHPMGPQGLWARAFHGALVASSLVVGLCWLAFPWPSRAVAIAFVCWADLSMAIGAGLLSAVPSRLCATIHMGLIGVFAAFLLGWRVLSVHCVFATVTIGVITAWNVHLGQATFFDQYIYVAPALSSVVLLPIIIQVVIEGGRKSLRATAVAAERDPLTGLLNRRGLQSAMDILLRGNRNTATVSMALVDVDRLKELNDTQGHEAGDTTLKAVARTLVSATRAGDIAARWGGDEFIVVAFHDHAEDADGFVRRMRALPSDIGPSGASVSVGTASRSTSDPDFDFESLRRQADASLYDAKNTPLSWTQG